jgi:hypothetical protein
LNSAFRSKSYKLWLLKARLELDLELLEECEMSLVKASNYASSRIDSIWTMIRFESFSNKRALKRLNNELREEGKDELKFDDSKDYGRMLLERENAVL